MSPSEIILHWLDYSRSHRILWLLEELNVPYDVKVYRRDRNFRAPKELKQVHPLGKSPVIEVVRAGQDNLIVAETGRIIEYLIENYDKQGKLVPKNKDDQGMVSYWLHYTEGTLQGILTALFVFLKARQYAPFGTKTIVGVVTGQISKQFYGSEALVNLNYLEEIAKKNNGGFFVANQLTGADIALCFPLAESIFADKERAKDFLGQDPEVAFPYLAKWAHLVLNHPTFLKATEVIATKSKL